MSFRIFLFQFLIVRKGGLFCAVVLYNYIFIIPITAFFLNRPDTSFQIINMVLVRYYNRYQRIIFPKIVCSVKSQIFSIFHSGLYSNPVIMSKNGILSCFKSVFFTFRIFCSGILMTTPVIQYFRNMINLLSSRIFNTAENKIIVLCAVELFPQHSYLLDNFFSDHKKMTDVIYCA